MAQPHRWPRLFSGSLTFQSPSEGIRRQPARVDSPSQSPRGDICERDSCALQETLDIFDSWSKRFLGVCHMHLGVSEGRLPFADAMDSIAASHWILPELFARLSHCAADGASVGEAGRPFSEFRNLARAKHVVEAYLNSVRLSLAHAGELRGAIADLDSACAEFRKAICGRIERAR